MTNFSFDNSIPATNNNPSNDQMGMLTNNQSTQSILAVDHVTFGVDNGGTHLQQTYYTQQAGTRGSALAVNYPGARPSVYSSLTAETSTNIYTTNALGIFPNSMIKAGGTFTTAASTTPIVPDSQFNINGNITNAGASTRTYGISLLGLPENASIIVLTGTSVSMIGDASWSFSGTTLTITSTLAAGNKISFIVLQV